MRYLFDDSVFDTAQHTLERQGQPVQIPPRVFAMLAYLLEHRQRVVPRQELFEQVWQGAYVSKAALDGCIKQVRQAIGDSGRAQRLLKTQHGVGYQWVASVRVQDESAADAAAADLVSTEFAAPLAISSPSVPERRQLTVLSCALADAAYLFNRLDPEELHAVLRAFHNLCVDTVMPYGGWIAQRVDDGCLIYFGYPQAHDDDARRAVLSALHLIEVMRTGLPELAAWMEGVSGVKIGIHTGEVVVEVVDDGVSPDALVVGSTATLASALRDLAMPQTVVISADSARLVEGYVTWQALPPVTLPAQSDPMPLYQVTGASGAQMRLDLMPAHRLTPFVGREAELALLGARWEQAREGRGQAVVVSGEAGIGKSRLARRLAEQLMPSGCTVLEGRGSPYHQQSAFYPLTEVLRRLLRLDDALADDDLVGQCEVSLQQYGLEVHQHLPFVASLLNATLPSGGDTMSSLSPQRRRQRTLASLTALVLAVADGQPLLLILEDLHWIDPSTLEWLDLLLDQIPTTSILLLLTCRPEFAPPWPLHSYLTQVTLDRLERLCH
jgi:DNA-binding winged helix-turn-helix (wHTH) protein